MNQRQDQRQFKLDVPTQPGRAQILTFWYGNYFVGAASTSCGMDGGHTQAGHGHSKRNRQEHQQGACTLAVGLSEVEGQS